MNQPYLLISTASDLLRVQARHVLYIQSDGNYSMLYLTNGEARLITAQLGQLEQLIDRQFAGDEPTFVRIGKTLIINIRYVFYINPTKQQLQMLDIRQTRHDLSVSQRALRELKEWWVENSYLYTSSCLVCHLVRECLSLQIAIQEIA